MTHAALSIKPVWITDPHLDHLADKDPEALNRLGSVLDALAATHILLGGDIADSRNFETHLRRFADAVLRPIFFVLGNHDYYFGSVAGVHRTVSAINIPGVSWLSAAGVTDLGEGTALVGQGGWGDGRCGDFHDFVVLTDYAAISDLAATIDTKDFWVNGFQERDALLTVLRRLGNESADALEADMEKALSSGTCRRILILTHVPPFREICTHRNGPGNDRGFPAFLWNSMGPRLVRIAESHPETDFLVFSGHTHSESSAGIAPNLQAWSSAAEYGELRLRILNPEKHWAPGELISS